MNVAHLIQYEFIAFGDESWHINMYLSYCSSPAQICWFILIFLKFDHHFGK